ncbi:hypothetical protein [Mesorhizobium sp. M1322]|uniref:hypothetical protein n=1 Tax=Mesorhizobium sp. M1322 TaxID=2957081 RepID=UPI003336E8BE
MVLIMTLMIQAVAPVAAAAAIEHSKPVKYSVLCGGRFSTIRRLTGGYVRAAEIRFFALIPFPDAMYRFLTTLAPADP